MRRRSESIFRFVTDPQPISCGSVTIMDLSYLDAGQTRQTAHSPLSLCYGIAPQRHQRSTFGLASVRPAKFRVRN